MRRTSRIRWMLRDYVHTVLRPLSWSLWGFVAALLACYLRSDAWGAIAAFLITGSVALAVASLFWWAWRWRS